MQSLSDAMFAWDSIDMSSLQKKYGFNSVDDCLGTGATRKILLRKCKRAILNPDDLKKTMSKGREPAICSMPCAMQIMNVHMCCSDRRVFICGGGG